MRFLFLWHIFLLICLCRVGVGGGRAGAAVEGLVLSRQWKRGGVDVRLGWVGGGGFSKCPVLLLIKGGLVQVAVGGWRRGGLGEGRGVEVREQAAVLRCCVSNMICGHHPPPPHHFLCFPASALWVMASSVHREGGWGGGGQESIGFPLAGDISPVWNFMSIT